MDLWVLKKFSSATWPIIHHFADEDFAGGRRVYWIEAFLLRPVKGDRTVIAKSVYTLGSDLPNCIQWSVWRPSANVSRRTDLLGLCWTFSVSFFIGRSISWKFTLKYLTTRFRHKLMWRLCLWVWICHCRIVSVMYVLHLSRPPSLAWTLLPIHRSRIVRAFSLLILRLRPARDWSESVVKLPKTI